MDKDQLARLTPPASVTDPGTPPPSLDRRTVRDVRRRARRQRRLYALGGLSVLAVFLAATIIVVDMVR